MRKLVREFWYGLHPFFRYSILGLLLAEAAMLLVILLTFAWMLLK